MIVVDEILDKGQERGLYKDWTSLRAAVKSGADDVALWLKKYIDSDVYSRAPIDIATIIENIFYNASKTADAMYDRETPAAQLLVDVIGIAIRPAAVPMEHNSQRKKNKKSVILFLSPARKQAALRRTRPGMWLKNHATAKSIRLHLRPAPASWQ